MLLDSPPLRHTDLQASAVHLYNDSLLLPTKTVRCEGCCGLEVVVQDSPQAAKVLVCCTLLEQIAADQDLGSLGGILDDDF